MLSAYRWTQQDDGSFRIRFVEFRVMMVHANTDPEREHRGMFVGVTLTRSAPTANWREVLLAGWTRALHEFPFLQIDVKLEHVDGKPLLTGSYRSPSLAQLKQQAAERLVIHESPKESSPFLWVAQGGAGKLSDNLPSKLHAFPNEEDNSVTLCLIAHHVVTDSQGCMPVFNTIARSIDQYGIGQAEAHIVPGDEIARLPLPLASYIGTRKDGHLLTEEEEQVLKQKIKQIDSLKPRPVDLAQQTSPPSFAVHDRCLELSQAHTSALLRVVKSHGCKLGRILTGISAVSVAIASKERSDGHDIVMFMAINSRSLLFSQAHRVECGVMTRSSVPPAVLQRDAALRVADVSNAGPNDYNFDSIDRAITEYQQSRVLPTIEEEIIQSLLKSGKKVPVSCLQSFVGPFDGMLDKQHGSVTMSKPECGPLTRSPCLSFSCWSFDGKLTLRVFGHQSHFDRALIDMVANDFFDRVLALARQDAALVQRDA